MKKKEVKKLEIFLKDLSERVELLEFHEEEAYWGIQSLKGIKGRDVVKGSIKGSIPNKTGARDPRVPYIPESEQYPPRGLSPYEFGELTKSVFTPNPVSETTV